MADSHSFLLPARHPHFLITFAITTSPPTSLSYSPSLRSGTNNQGLVHMGKGTIGLNPFYHDGTVMSHGAMAGLLSVIISFTDAKSCEYFRLSSFLFLPNHLFPLPVAASTAGSHIYGMDQNWEMGFWG